MSLYGHAHIDREALKRWANALNTEKMDVVDVGGQSIHIDESMKNLLETQIHSFSKQIKDLPPEGDWRGCEGVLSQLFYNAFVRVDNSSIKIGDFFECLITPSNMKTYKKIFRGYESGYLDVGAIHLYEDGQAKASIGEKSDLIWSTFYHYFMDENEYGSRHIYANHDIYLSIQLFGVEDKSLDELYDLVNEILLSVSMKVDMDFRIFELDPLIKEIGQSDVHRLQYSSTGFERVPVLYLNNAINAQDERLAYLSFYQAIEYFFVRAQNNSFLNEFSGIDMGNVNHSELRKILNNYRKNSSEREALRLVFEKAIDTAKIKNWLDSCGEIRQRYADGTNLEVSSELSDKKIISRLVDRVYSFRCSIAHAKGDVEEYIAIPSLSKERILNELPLIKYLAFETITAFSID